MTDDNEQITSQSLGIGDAAAELIEVAKNLTTQERIKIAIANGGDAKSGTFDIVVAGPG